MSWSAKTNCALFSFFAHPHRRRITIRPELSKRIAIEMYGNSTQFRRNANSSGVDTPLLSTTAYGRALLKSVHKPDVVYPLKPITKPITVCTSDWNQKTEAEVIDVDLKYFLENQTWDLDMYVGPVAGNRCCNRFPWRLSYCHNCVSLKLICSHQASSAAKKEWRQVLS